MSAAFEHSDIRLVALDLDGTLFDPDGRVSETDRLALREAAAAGVEIVIASGRPYGGLPHSVMEDIGVHYAITANGAGLYSFPDKVCLFEDCLPEEELPEIMAWLEEHEIYFDIFSDGDSFSTLRNKALLPRLIVPDNIRAYMAATRVYLEDLPGFLHKEHRKVQKITMNCCREPDGTLKNREAAVQYLSSFDDICLVSGGYQNLEINHRGVAKGKAMLALAEHLGIRPEQTMACGDSGNDLDMIRRAGIGVAMANATEEIKAASRYITLSNAEGGVAHAVRELVLKGKV